MAELIISSAPLRHLESVMTDDYNVSLGTFLETFFKKKDFPALTEIQLRNGDEPDGPNLLPLLTSQNWVTNLTNLELHGSMDVTADDLQAFLKASENGALQRFQLNQVPIEELPDGFRNRKLYNLEYLWLIGLDCSDLSLGDDLSNHFNGLVDCFPKLKYIKLDCDSLDFHHDVDLLEFKWTTPPRKHLAELLPHLEEIHLSGFVLCVDVVQYLGESRRRGIIIDADGCIVHAPGLAPDKIQFLANLNLTAALDGFHALDSTLCVDCLYWNAISDAQFKLLAYAAALYESRDARRLQNFITSVEAEDEGSVMTPEAVESLRSLVSTMLYQNKRL